MQDEITRRVDRWNKARDKWAQEQAEKARQEAAKYVEADTIDIMPLTQLKGIIKANKRQRAIYTAVMLPAFAGCLTAVYFKFGWQVLGIVGMAAVVAYLFKWYRAEQRTYIEWLETNYERRLMVKGAQPHD